MKKTLTVNLNNTVFHIDDDAYEILKKYLTDISLHFSSDEDKDDIMADIEGRIAELFSERLQENKQVITLADVKEIITIMGKPSEFSNDDNEESKEKQKSEKKQRKARRFYRDPENAILGGIAGGISAYFNWDVVLIRIILVLLVFLGFGIIIPVYIVAWIITPAATTAAQRLEMQGEDVTIDNIKNEFENMKNYVQSDKFKSSAKSVGNKLSDVLLSIFKVLFGLIGVILGFVGFIILGALILALVIVIIQPAFFESFSIAPFFYWIPLRNFEFVSIISGILIVICPLSILIYGIVRLLSKRKRKFSGAFFWVVLVIWIISLVVFIRADLTRVDPSKSEKNNYHSWTWNDGGSLTKETRTIEKYHSIEAMDNISLYLLQDSIYRIEILTYENLLSKVETDVKDGKLTIKTNGVIANHSPKVYVTAPDFKRIDVRGAVSVESKKPLQLKSLEIDAAGASNIEMNLLVDSLIKTSVQGASHVEFNGKTKYLDIDSKGAAEIDTDDLKAEFVRVKTKGASSVNVHASESINIDCRGINSVRYSGNPKIVNR